MPTQQKKQFKSYMKPVQKRVTIQKPEWKKKGATSKVNRDGFTRISDSTIRKVYS